MTGRPVTARRKAEGRKSIGWQLSASDHVWEMLRREGARGVDAQGLTIDSV